MVVEKNIIIEKLEQLKRYLSQIENMNFNEDILEENIDIRQLLSFRLQQSIEVCIDIATYIIANASFPKAETARDAFIVLSKNKVISPKTAENMALAGGFRNLIVHGYGKVDFRRVFRNYKKDLEDIRSYASEIFSYINQ